MNHDAKIDIVASNYAEDYWKENERTVYSFVRRAFKDGFLLGVEKTQKQKIDGKEQEKKKNSPLYNYALSEMIRAFPEAQLDREVPDENVDGMQRSICKNILDIVKLFCEQQHSGISAAYTIQYATRLLNYQPICPLTGDDDEWGEPDVRYKDLQQNKRCFHVFREKFDNSTAYDMNGKIFSEDGGKTFFTSKDSFVPVKFPYMPPDKPEEVILS